jgi:glutamate/tyrosine decarboxylase-like PLP-dependent enzyme
MRCLVRRRQTLAHPIALALGGQYNGVLRETIEQRGRQFLVATEDARPLAKARLNVTTMLRRPCRDDARMSAMTLRELLSTTAGRAIDYLEALPRRRVFPSAEAIANLAQLGGPLPVAPQDPAAVLALLDELGSPATVASNGARYFGFVIGAALPVTVAAHWLADAWDQNACLIALSPVAAALDEIALEWLRELLRLPRGCGGALVTGAQMASFTGLAAARHALLARAGWDVEADGLFGAPPITVVVGEEAHVTIFKALSLLGLGGRRVIVVPADAQGRMRVAALPPLSGPTIICAQAGNVNSGAFDPLGELCERARASGAWVHVDGAFGAWAAAAPSLAHLTAGMEQADSWASDGHKWLNVPYDCGVAFVRDPLHLRAAMSISAAYLAPTNAREPLQWGPESSRRARGVEVWAALRGLGQKGVAELVERCCAHARAFADRLRGAGYDVLNDVVLNQVLVSFGDDATTRAVIAGVQADGTCWCGGTQWHGRAAMRISVSSWATTADDVERCAAAMIRVAREVTAHHG